MSTHDATSQDLGAHKDMRYIRVGRLGVLFTETLFDTKVATCLELTRFSHERAW